MPWWAGSGVRSTGSVLTGRADLRQVERASGGAGGGLGGALDVGGETPGAVDDDPYRVADVLGVVDPFDVSVSKPQRRAKDAFHAKGRVRALHRLALSAAPRQPTTEAVVRGTRRRCLVDRSLPPGLRPLSRVISRASPLAFEDVSMANPPRDGQLRTYLPSTDFQCRPIAFRSTQRDRERREEQPWRVRCW